MAYGPEWLSSEPYFNPGNRVVVCIGDYAGFDGMVQSYEGAGHYLVMLLFSAKYVEVRGSALIPKE